MQHIAQQMFDLIDEWWDGLSIRDFDRWENAPRYQRRAFAALWPNVDSRGNPRQWGLPARPDGQLRPWFNNWGNREFEMDASLRQTLLAPSVVVSSELTQLGNLRWLLAVRPLIEDGTLLFATRDHWKMNAVAFQQAVGEYPVSDAEALEVSRVYSPDEPGLEADYVSTQALFEYSPMMDFFVSGTVTPSAVTRVDERILSRLLEGHVVDNRSTRLSKLAQFELPKFRADTQALVSIRRGSESLQLFRGALGDALDSISHIEAGSAAAREAPEIVFDHVQSALPHVRREVDRSGTLSQMKSGITSIGLSGLGAGLPGVLAQDPLIAISAGAAGAIAGGAADAFLKAIAGRRVSKEVWSIMTTFRDQG